MKKKFQLCKDQNPYKPLTRHKRTLTVEQQNNRLREELEKRNSTIKRFQRNLHHYYNRRW